MSQMHPNEFTTAEIAVIHECFGAALAVLSRLKGRRLPSAVRDNLIAVQQRLSVAQSTIGTLWLGLPVDALRDAPPAIEHAIDVTCFNDRHTVHCACGWWSADFPDAESARGVGDQHLLMEESR